MGEKHDEHARDRLTPFLLAGRLSVEQRDALLRGGDRDDHGEEICACFSVSSSAIDAAIADGALSLEAIGAATRAGTNCGSCRPEIRTLLRGARRQKAA